MIRRGSPEWKRTYRKHWSIERVFRRWDTLGWIRSHYFQHRARIHLHMLFQMPSLQATILVKPSTERAAAAAIAAVRSRAREKCQ